MADNDELKTNRLSGVYDDGVDLAARWPNFEAAMRHIFGIPADTAMSEAMTIVAGGDVTMTGTLLASGAPTVDLHAATKAYVQGNSSEFGLERCRAYLTSDIVLDPGGGSTYIPWDDADINDSEMWDVANPTRITSQGGRDFLCGFSLSFDAAAGISDGWFEIRRNRSTTYRSTLVFESNAITDEVGVSGVCFAANLTPDEYLELRYTPRSAIPLLHASSATFWATVIRAT